MTMKRKHPLSLWILTFSYMGFTFSFGTVLSITMIFLNTSVGLSESNAYVLTSAIMSLTFVMTLIGGFLCDHLGFKNCTIVGFIFVFIGFCILGSSANHLALYLGFSAFLAGNTFCTPAIFSQIGLIYKKDNVLRESGSTIFYMLFNVGFLLSTTTAPFLSKTIGYHIVFLINGFGALIGLIIYLLFSKKITLLDLADQTNKICLKQQIKAITCGVLLIFIAYYLLNHPYLNSIIQVILVALSFGYIVYLILSKKSNQIQAQKMIAFICLCLAALFYFIIYNTEFSLIPEYTLHAVDRVIFGIDLPASIVVSSDAVFCIIIGSILIKLWSYLSKINKNPSLPTKFTIGLFSASLGYLVLSLLLSFNLDSKLGISWIPLSFMFFVVAELLIFAIGISMTSKLAPKGHEGFFMGVWTLTVGFSALLSGYVGGFTSIRANETIIEMNHTYLNIFLIIGVCAFISALILLMGNKKLKSLLHD